MKTKNLVPVWQNELETKLEQELNKNRLTMEDEIGGNMDLLGATLQDIGVWVDFENWRGEYEAIYSMNEALILEIGTQDLRVSPFETFGELVRRIAVTIFEEDKKIMKANNYSIEIGCKYVERPMELEKMCLEQVCTYIREQRYCDTEFAEWLREAGYHLKRDAYPNSNDFVVDYVDISATGHGKRIWFEKVNEAHSLYQRTDVRERLEVLYLLVSLKYEEAIFGVEL